MQTLELPPMTVGNAFKVTYVFASTDTQGMWTGRDPARARGGSGIRIAETAGRARRALGLTEAAPAVRQAKPCAVLQITDHDQCTLSAHCIGLLACAADGGACGQLFIAGQHR
jgi:hypothetical protein